MKHLLTSFIFAISLGTAQASDMVVSLDDILMLSQRGVSDETILVFLQNRELGFTPDADDIDSLLEAGLSEEIVRYLLQQTPAKPTEVSSAVVYVDPYPPYYYRPYYTRTSLFLGFSAFPHTISGRRHHGGVRHNRPHHGRSHSYESYNNTYSTRGNLGSITHTGAPGRRHGITGAGHITPHAGHDISVVEHDKTGSIGHADRNQEHIKTTSINHNTPGVGHSTTTRIKHVARNNGHDKTGSINHSSSGSGQRQTASVGHSNRSIGHSSSGSKAHSGGSSGGHSGGRSRGHGGGHF
jgi:uncharacterized membrane protein YgcG